MRLAESTFPLAPILVRSSNLFALHAYWLFDFVTYEAIEHHHQQEPLDAQVARTMVTS